jgi:hypothetical protein
MAWCGAMSHDPSQSDLISEEPLPQQCSAMEPPHGTIPRWYEGMLHFMLQTEHCLLATHAALLKNPRTLRMPLAAAFIVIAGLFSRANAASAQTAPGNGFLNGILNHLASDTMPFFANSFAVADTIFSAVGTMVVILSLASYLTHHRTLSGYGPKFLDLIFKIAIPWTFLRISEQTLTAWSTVSTNVGSYIIGASSMNATPDGIFKTGAALAREMIMNVAQNMFIEARDKGINVSAALVYVCVAFIAIFGGIVLFITFTMLAVEMLSAFAQGYISLSVGAFQLGWSASSATSNFASAYWGLVQSVITRIIVTMAIIGISLNESRDWIAQLHSLETVQPDLLAQNIYALLQIPCLGVGMLYLTTKVTDFAAAQLSGRPILSGSGAVMAANPTLGSIGGAAIGGAFGAASGAVSGAVNGFVQSGGNSVASAGSAATGAVGGAFSGAANGAHTGRKIGNAFDRPPRW